MLELFKRGASTAALTILLSTGLGVFVRTVSRNDKQRSFVSTDFSVGLEVIVALIGLLIAESIDYFATSPQLNIGELTMCMVFLVALTVMLWGLSTIIRKIGWKNDNDLHLIWVSSCQTYSVLWFSFTFLSYLTFYTDD